ncbi:MAG: class I SAM-dependent methyltransferase [Mesorhizobium sp.]|uniref:class I SAM-dependent methyltransferase n=2 Tax=Mesorhizobium TaxID=68287 RepID=UPI000F764280|nr:MULTISPECIES: class I SAM-dependent methyltransferase [unclassified Mesorhizobium]AZO47678.1 class I SAM-dependent methyltransferase [Mesorhizobium sp. M4B.F.Ca.ET.058.02.1.1]RWC53933.1 MAG: class I SAM-dependent methyltransferase [Mesorhizobium sp.]RWD13155.1 MAG: class I SAM-dependent methyltransferase [Mesorhizobium sp.]RWD53982.1 MAG: class I SAM-dependent methyltransferase [Mesorhizobium sp.]TIV82243.1 MAG: class I SAM-dependent methyltransferase [Mesorhizobium sp.]
MTEHWNAIRKHWQLLGSPLRPPAQVVEAYERELELAQSHVVMLGVTPELAGLGATMIAVDESADMIAGIWPGDTDMRKAVRGDWFDLPFPGASIDALIGDGCLSAIGDAEARRALFSAIASVLKADGRAGIRLYASPETPDDPKDVRALALGGGVSTFHELKWRVAMTAISGVPDYIIPVTRIFEQFEAIFPDRVELSARTGWDLPVIGTIDVYRNSSAIYSFAPADAVIGEAHAFFDNVGVVPTGTYGLAERCPLLALRSPRR